MITHVLKVTDAELDDNAKLDGSRFELLAGDLDAGQLDNIHYESNDDDRDVIEVKLNDSDMIQVCAGDLVVVSEESVTAIIRPTDEIIALLVSQVKGNSE